MLLIIREFLLKSTIFCKKNTKNSFFTTKSKNNGFLYFVKLFYIRVYMVFNKKNNIFVKDIE
ncbi:hypothetical protein [uncultured Gammaproteobacteria bacterium]|nr:hypothetical protein [uncultured Gammaproteobacteria bacterium]